jgi:hypothetical protein
VGVDRFAGNCRHLKFRYRCLAFALRTLPNFATFTIKEIANQSEQAIQLTPENCRCCARRPR